MSGLHALSIHWIGLVSRSASALGDRFAGVESRCVEESEIGDVCDWIERGD